MRGSVLFTALTLVVSSVFAVPSPGGQTHGGQVQGDQDHGGHDHGSDGSCRVRKHEDDNNFWVNDRLRGHDRVDRCSTKTKCWSDKFKGCLPCNGGRIQTVQNEGGYPIKVCTCPTNHILSNSGTCVPSCKSPRVQTSNGCACPEHSWYRQSDNTCQCNSGCSRNSKGECKPDTPRCPPGTELNHAKTDCVCKTGKDDDKKVYNKDAGKCVCKPEFTPTLFGGCGPKTPECPSGTKLDWFTKKCVCNTGKDDKKKVYDEEAKGCVCKPPLETLPDGGCGQTPTCPTGATHGPQGCVCDDDDKHIVESACVCKPPLETLTDGGCGQPLECPIGQKPEGKVCVCNTGTHDTLKDPNNNCACNAGLETVGNSCLDPCPDDQEYGAGDVCVCKDNRKTVVSGTCVCHGDYETVGENCFSPCPNGQTRVGSTDTCECKDPNAHKPPLAVITPTKREESASVCVCNDDYEKVEGVELCQPVCGSDQERRGADKHCECTDPNAWVPPKEDGGEGTIFRLARRDPGPVCQCKPTFTSVDGDGLCACPVGQHPVEGECKSVCDGQSADYEVVGQQCLLKCPDDQERDKTNNECKCKVTNAIKDGDGLCACPAGQHEVEGKCEGICAGKDETYEVVGQLCLLKCPNDQERDLTNNGCKCKVTNAIKDNGVCTCPKDHHEVGGECKHICAGYPANYEVVGQECLPPCHLTQVRVSGQCTCPENTVDNGSGVCQPECPDGQRYGSSGCECEDEYAELTPSGCVCIADYVPFKGNCVPDCPDDQTHDDDGNCQCTEDDKEPIPIGGHCVCKSGNTWNGACVDPCPLDQERKEGGNGNCECKDTNAHPSQRRRGLFKRAGTCVCNDGYKLVGNSCQLDCPDQIEGGVCVCKSRPFEVYDGKECVCQDKYEKWNNVCTLKCPLGATRKNNGDCQCTESNQGYDPETKDCKCTQGFEMTADRKCIRSCPDVRNPQGNCVCTTLPNETYQSNSNSCVCKSGYSRVNGICTANCPSNSKREGAVCVCNDGNAEWNSDTNKCNCKPGFTLNKGVCR